MTDEERQRITKEEVVKAAERRRRTAKEMAKDDGRTKRQREVEACFSQSLPAILESLKDECSSKTEMIREINKRLKANGYEDTLSRPTLYSWMDDLGLK